MAVFDVVPFFDELDLLDIRLNLLDPYVDFFVISEFSTSFAGNAKPFYYKLNQDLFEKFRNKIISFTSDQNQILDPFANDDFQKNAIKKMLDPYLSGRDVIFFGDVDEIPNPIMIQEVLARFERDSFFHFAQDISYGYLNYRHTNHMLTSQAGEYPYVRKKKWLGTIACSPQILKQRTISQLRYPETKQVGVRLHNGGWHFSYCGGFNQPLENRVRHKIINNAHQEFNNSWVHSQINQAFERKGDLLGRSEKRRFLPGLKKPKFKVIEISELPEYIGDNASRFGHLFLGE